MFSCLTFNVAKPQEPTIEEQQPAVEQYTQGPTAQRINPQLAGTPENFQVPIIPRDAKVIQLADGEAPPSNAVAIQLAPAGFVPIVPKNYNNSAHLTVGDVSRIEGGNPADPCDIALNNYLAYKNIQYQVKKVADREYQFHGFAHAVIFLNERGYLCALYQDANGSQIISIDDVMDCVQALIDEHVKKVNEETQRIAEEQARIEAAAVAAVAAAAAAKAAASPKKKAASTASPKKSPSKSSAAGASPKKSPSAKPKAAAGSAKSAGSAKPKAKAASASAKSSPKAKASPKKK